MSLSLLPPTSRSASLPTARCRARRRGPASRFSSPVFAALHPTLFGCVYAGVLDMLAALRRRELPLVLVTGKSRPTPAEITREPRGLGPFQVVVTTRKVREAKPDPEGLLPGPCHLGLRRRSALTSATSGGSVCASARVDARGIPSPRAPVGEDARRNARSSSRTSTPSASGGNSRPPDQLIRADPDPARSITKELV